MTSDAMLSVVALVVPSLLVVCLVLPTRGRSRSRARSCAELGPSGAELIPSAPSPRPVDRRPVDRRPLEAGPVGVPPPAPALPRAAAPRCAAVSSPSVSTIRTRRSFAVDRATGATGALVIAASSATAGMRSRTIVSSTARRYAYVIDATGRVRPRRRALVAASVGAVVVAAMIASR